MTAPRTLARDRRGAVGVLAAVAFPVLIGAGALAVDLGSAALDARRLQGMADAAALAAAVDPAQAQARAEASVAKAGWGRPLTVTAVAGAYSTDLGLKPAARFTAGAAAANAVRVTLSGDTPTFLARVFGRGSVPVSRGATAARERLAAFAVGGRLAGVGEGALNQLLSGLTGSRVSLGLVDYQALAGADVDAAGLTRLLGARIGADGASYAGIANTRVPVGEVVGAMADATDGTARDALNRLASQLAGQAGGTVALADLIDLGPYREQSSGAEGLVRLNALSAVSALLRGASGPRVVNMDLGVPGLANVHARLVYGVPMRSSPWVSIDERGDTVVRTSQARLHAVAELGSFVGLRIPLYAELGKAEARLADLACPAPDARTVTLEARPGALSVALGEVSDARLTDFTRDVPVTDAELLRAVAVTIEGQAPLDAGAAEPWQSVPFGDAAIRAGETRTVAGTNPVSGLTTSLANRVSLRTYLLGIPVPATALTRSVGVALSAAAPLIDALLSTAAGAAGLQVGAADVRVTGARCGTAALVA